MTRIGRAIAVAGMALVVTVPAAAQNGGEGPYTAEQANRGEKVFQDICSMCHTPTQFSGPAFLRAWNGATAYDLFTLIRTTMPFDNPGQLGREQYADVMAYVLRLNGSRPGARELPSDDAGLRQVKIELPAPE